ncbi:MAG: hypothetical protein WA432_00155 [Candidatus Babeliaceae bacterium]
MLSQSHKARMYTGEFILGTLTPFTLLSGIGLCCIFARNSWQTETRNSIFRNMKDVQEKSINKIYSLNQEFHYQQRRELFKNETPLKTARRVGYTIGTVSGFYILWKLVNSTFYASLDRYS